MGIYCSGRSRSSGSSARRASSSLWSSSTAGCLPCALRLDDASACPIGDSLDGELDMPSSYALGRAAAHSSRAHDNTAKIESEIVRVSSWECRADVC